ncbi:MAG: hypothetical protein ACREE0_10910 [Phenylobacterium sp.]
MSDESSLNAAEELIPLAESAGISLMHMALALSRGRDFKSGASG